jgi:hypothetical protein
LRGFFGAVDFLLAVVFAALAMARTVIVAPVKWTRGTQNDDVIDARGVA